jgi:hypothetical protein
MKQIKRTTRTLVLVILVVILPFFAITQTSFAYHFESRWGDWMGSSFSDSLNVGWAWDFSEWAVGRNIDTGERLTLVRDPEWITEAYINANVFPDVGESANATVYIKWTGEFSGGGLRLEDYDYSYAFAEVFINGPSIYQHTFKTFETVVASAVFPIEVQNGIGTLGVSISAMSNQHPPYPWPYTTVGSGTPEIDFMFMEGNWEVVEYGVYAYIDPGIQTFEILGTTAPVPEPTTMLLLGSGLIGLVGFKRKFRK